MKEAIYVINTVRLRGVSHKSRYAKSYCGNYFLYKWKTLFVALLVLIYLNREIKFWLCI